MGLTIHFPPFGRSGVAAPGRLSLCPDSRTALQNRGMHDTVDRFGKMASLHILPLFTF